MEKTPAEATLEKAKAKILSFQEYSDNREKYKDPYVFEVVHNEKRLVCIGANHDHDPSNPQFSLIEEELDKADPDLVYIEGRPGIRKKMAAMPDKVQEFIDEQTTESLIANRKGEVNITLHHALSRGIEVDSPELTDSQVCERLLDGGFSKEAIYLFHIFRMVPQLHEEGTGESLVEGLQHERETMLQELGIPIEDDMHQQVIDIASSIGIALTRDDVEDFDVTAFASDPTFNLGDRERTEINEVASAVSGMRDEYILERLHNDLKDYDTVFMVYGASHIHMLEDAFTSLLEST